MGRVGKNLLGAVVVLLIIVSGVFLPERLMMRHDRAIVGQVHREALDEAEKTDYVNISMVEKVSLLSPSAGASLVPLAAGSMYDHDTIRGRFIEEFDKLHLLRLFPRPASGEMSAFRSVVALRIVNDAPAVNMIAWEISVRMDTISGLYIMDDQTGKILSFDISSSGYEETIYSEKSVRDCVAYLGAEAKNIKSAEDTQGNAVYEFELSSGSKTVSCRLVSMIDENDNENRWNLSYFQVTDDTAVITRE